MGAFCYAGQQRSRIFIEYIRPRGIEVATHGGLQIDQLQQGLPDATVTKSGLLVPMGWNRPLCIGTFAFLVSQGEETDYLSTYVLPVLEDKVSGRETGILVFSLSEFDILE